MVVRGVYRLNVLETSFVLRASQGSVRDKIERRSSGGSCWMWSLPGFGGSRSLPDFESSMIGWLDSLMGVVL